MLREGQHCTALLPASSAVKQAHSGLAVMVTCRSSAASSASSCCSCQAASRLLHAAKCSPAALPAHITAFSSLVWHDIPVFHRIARRAKPTGPA